MNNNKTMNATVYNELVNAGWFNGRCKSSLVNEWEKKILSANKREMFESAKVILTEYGGLIFGEIKPGLECSRSKVNLDPSVAIYEQDRF